MEIPIDMVQFRTTGYAALLEIQQINSPYVCKISDAALLKKRNVVGRTLVTVMELIEGDDLSRYTFANQNELLQMLYDVTSGLIELKTKSVFCNNILQPRNIMRRTAGGRYVLIDFDGCKITQDQRELFSDMDNFTSRMKGANGVRINPAVVDKALYDEISTALKGAKTLEALNTVKTRIAGINGVTH